MQVIHVLLQRPHRRLIDLRHVSTLPIQAPSGRRIRRAFFLARASVCRSDPCRLVRQVRAVRWLTDMPPCFTAPAGLSGR